MSRKIPIFSIVFLLITANIFAQKNAGFIGDKKIYYGAAYYPEAWNFKTLDEDIKYMKELNMNVMRMAEFSWALMEPKEGVFDFQWLHQVVDKLHENDIDVILGTPTATPPTWLGEKHPEIYAMDENGIRRTHGARRNCNYLNEVYRKKSAIICEKMAQEFGKKPNVIGWQTDNEFNLLDDFSENTRKVWHQWLKEKFNTIENLNKAWCTQLWSQTYNTFEQIPLPRSTIWHHPSLLFNWYRFWNEQVNHYQDIQLKAIRKHTDQPITHDGMPGQQLNYEKLFDNLDYMSVNNYHSFEAYNRIQSNYDRMRGYKKGFHWLFETAPNNSGGGRKGNTWFLHQPDGSMRAAMWMNYALGGQGTMFWLWRQHPAGQEMPHGSVISVWGKPAANYNDLKQLGAELNTMSNFLMEHPVAPAQAAIFWSHENLAGLRIEEYANGISYYKDWTYRFYRPLADAFIHRDVIAPGMDIAKYKLLFAPLMPYIPKELRNRLKKWVLNGGILILGPMSGYRNTEWAAFTDYALGDFATWTGMQVESRIPIGTKPREAEIPVLLEYDNSLWIKPSEASLWSEALSSEKGKILATYQNGMHNNLPAIIENKAGKGKVVLLGTDPGYQAFQKIALKYAGEAQIKPLATGNKDVVLVPRKGKNNALIVLNISNEKKRIALNKKYRTELLTNRKISEQKFELKPYQLLLLQE